MKTLTLLVLACAVGCSGDDEGDATVADAPRRRAAARRADGRCADRRRRNGRHDDSCAPTLDECTTGAFWADCGGSGAPRLACAGASCSWFTTSCLPAGYTASDCAADAICSGDEQDNTSLPDAAVASCPGPAPAIADCTTGDFWAYCGGSGPPRLACSEAQCSWFTTSCLASGYEGSDCAADAICCHDAYPFVRTSTTLSRDFALFRQLWGHGAQPRDGDRALDIEVEIDPALEHATVPGFTCTPPGGPGTVCDPLTRSAAMFEGVGGDRITFTLGDKLAFLYGVLKHVEIDAARRRARVCDFFFTDAITWRCHAMPVLCYTAGTLTLPEIPKLLVVSVSLRTMSLSLASNSMLTSSMRMNGIGTIAKSGTVSEKLCGEPSPSFFS